MDRTQFINTVSAAINADNKSDFFFKLIEHNDVLTYENISLRQQLEKEKKYCIDIMAHVSSLSTDMHMLIEALEAYNKENIK